MATAPVINFDEPIPLFPLPGCVLLPHATVPLHIFEERYRRMVSDALAGPRLIAAAVFAGAAWKSDYQGTPPIRQRVCVGYIVKHSATPDGRYHLLLQGVCRARVRTEVRHARYRLGLLDPTETHWAMEIDLSEERRCLEALIHDPLLQQLAIVSAIHNWLSDEIPTPALIDLAVLTTTDDTEERYGMLAQDDVTRRAGWLRRHLRSLRRTLAVAQRFEPARSDEGTCLN